MNINGVKKYRKVTNGQKWLRVAEPGKRKGWNRGEGDCGGVRRGGGARRRGGGGGGVLGLVREEEDRGREGGGCCWLKGWVAERGARWVGRRWRAVAAVGSGGEGGREEEGRREKGRGVVRRWRLGGGGGVEVVVWRLAGGGWGKKKREGGEG
ncbi:uncharacterized protein LOC130949663 [Arachis stenosperma]|uniref:uncharacterized protein LOC130949663 n=1 Tax=Arachis stenosperma TaxID=217475 RepID=UPI0025AD42C1|nr:uncharacterized protein LOC130949663 [Arachis stenosperma]